MSDTLEASLMFLLLEYLVAECWFGPTIAGIFAALPDPALRGTTQGSFALLTAFGNTAPLLIAALLTDQGIAGTGVGANMPLQASFPSHAFKSVFFVRSALASMPSECLLCSGVSPSPPRLQSVFFVPGVGPSPPCLQSVFFVPGVGPSPPRLQSVFEMTDRGAE
ncbi:hypothetical protein CYMTET_44489 [Cymbomonas tetramitiformis]|uniref:Uncharacterized protein n=1 Tax=Cymbomonas tetramitiformis TaxID=36881 RepID=A0AAE0EZJ6_9CHLO|nr:hypothetical protein CYMTET_44489 [Cymbomonas tetramitiformis]